MSISQQTKLENKDSILSKFIIKAKKKLSGGEDSEKDDTKNKTLSIPATDYKFIKSNRKASYENLKSKVKTLLSKNPNCIDPITKLIVHSEYDNLPESSKERYILNLSKMYNDILSELNAI